MFKQLVRDKSSGGAYTLRNSVKLIQGGPAYFDLLETIIQAAKYTIHIQVYIYEEDDTGKRITHALLAAAARGVKIFVLVDGYASKNLSQEFMDTLSGAGIRFQRFEPIFQSNRFYFGRRLHHKVVVTDDSSCLVAGLNITDRYNDTVEAKAWLDWALYAEGDVAEILSRVCGQRLKIRLPIPEKDKTVSIGLADMTDRCAVRVRINDWVRRKREITNSYLEMLTTASSHVVIMSPYFLPGELIRRRIRQAVKRGVRIQVIQAGISDIAISKYAERYLYRWLFKNKVEIYEYQKTVLHGKIAVCDDRWMTVGSYNVNNLSAYASIELNLDVNNIDFAKKTQERLQDIITEECVQVTEEMYLRKTTFLDHLLQQGAYVALRVILFLFTFYFKQKE